ncbi:hypothetical protein Gpo141_00013241 [Globisporangium polare]
MVFQLSSERQYVDEQAAAQYAVNTGDEIEMKQVLNATAGEALDAWVQHIWLTGSGAQEVTPGVGRAYVNHTRLIPQLQIKEQIVSAGLPSENDGDKLAVPTILYKVRDAGLFPIVDHIALVRFIEDHSAETPTTELVWTIKLTLGTEGNAVFASPAMIPPFLQKAVTAALAALATTVDESKQQGP